MIESFSLSLKLISKFNVQKCLPAWWKLLLDETKEFLIAIWPFQTIYDDMYVNLLTHKMDMKLKGTLQLCIFLLLNITYFLARNQSVSKLN